MLLKQDYVGTMSLAIPIVGFIIGMANIVGIHKSFGVDVGPYPR
jgi:hypothetical protein